MNTSDDTIRYEIGALRDQLAGLRAEIEAQREAHREAFGQALGEYGNKLIDHVEASIKRLESMFWTAIERRFAELSARLDLVPIPDGRPKPREFKFANERDDDAADLPNPLTRRTSELN